MSIRYLLDPTRQAANRFDRELLQALSSEHELKAESTRPLREASEVWKSLYTIFSKALYAPRIHLFHGDLNDYVAHPLQWNVLCQPEYLPSQDYDEVWSFSTTDYERCLSLGCPPDQLICFEGFSPETAALCSAADLPIALEGDTMIFCSLHQLSDLNQALLEYLQYKGNDPSVMLALHLDVEATQAEMAENLLLESLEQSALALNLDMEILNIGTFIGKLSEKAYLACLSQSKTLWWPQSYFQAQEAKALGKFCIGGSYGQSTEASDASNNQTIASGFHFFNAVGERLQHLLTHVDFSAREAAYQQAKALEQQGRKQKYSLFHSDYDTEELKARRNWHATYAREFKDCPGDVLDIGSGSGLFLEIMRDDLQQPAFGIDPDEDMVNVCQKLGLNVLWGDEQKLGQFQMETLGGIHASHIIEHIDGTRAIALIENAFRVLRPSGLLLIRTPNWRNETVRQEGFWLDITHIRPYPLPLLKQVLQDAGFTVTKEGFETFGWNDTYILGQKPLISRPHSPGEL